MIIVFWLEHAAAGAEPVARFQPFAADELAAALKCAEALRSRRARGEGISHVSIQSELPQAVGPAGVADPDPGYAHYKRRIDPKIPLGRESGGAVAASAIPQPLAVSPQSPAVIPAEAGIQSVPAPEGGSTGSPPPRG